MCTRKQLWLQECGNGLWQEKFEGLGRCFTEISQKEIDELNEANTNLFRIKQKTVVENQALKGQLATAKREITTYRSFAEEQIRDLTRDLADTIERLTQEKEEAYQKGKTDGKVETLKDETLP